MCVVWLHMVSGVFVLDHLVWTRADAAHGAVFALDCLAEGFRAAPAEEEKGAEEDRADGGNDDAGDGTFA